MNVTDTFIYSAALYVGLLVCTQPPLQQCLQRPTYLEGSCMQRCFHAIQALNSSTSQRQLIAEFQKNIKALLISMSIFLVTVRIHEVDLRWLHTFSYQVVSLMVMELCRAVIGQNS